MSDRHVSGLSLFGGNHCRALRSRCGTTSRMAPKKGSRLQRQHGIFVYCTKEEKAAIVEAARRDRRSVSAFVPTVLLDHVARTRKNPPSK